MPVLPIGAPPKRRIPKLTRRQMLAISAAAGVAACAPQTAEQLRQAEANGIVPWPEDVRVPPVFAPGYGRYPDYDAIGETGPWPKIVDDLTKRQLEKYADLILPASDGPYGPAPSPSEVGIADFFDDWISAPYPYMSDTRRIVTRGMVWLDAQARHDFGTDWLGTTDEQAKSLLDRMMRADPDTGPMTHQRGMYDHLRKIIIGAYYTTPAGEADLGHVPPAPITGDYPGPTGEALAHTLALIEGLGLRTDDLPVGVAPYPDKAPYTFDADNPA